MTISNKKVIVVEIKAYEYLDKTLEITDLQKFDK